MTTDIVKALIYPGGQNSWRPLPEGWTVERYELDHHAPPTYGRWAYCVLDSKRGVASISSLDIFIDAASLTHEQADALNDIRQWCLIQLMEHRPGHATHDGFGTYAWFPCSCGGRFDRISNPNPVDDNDVHSPSGRWTTGTHYAPDGRQVDVIEAVS